MIALIRLASRRPWVIGSLLLCFGSAGFLSCKRADKNAAQSAPTPTSNPAAGSSKPANAAEASAAPKLRSGNTGILTPIEPHDPTGLPTRFDPSGRFMAVLDEKQGCMVWSIGDRTYVGNVPAQRCTDWQEAEAVSLPHGSKDEAADDRARDQKDSAPAPELVHQRVSPDGTLTAHWHGSKLWLTSKGGPELPLRVGCEKEKCAPVGGVAFSPDSTQLAITRDLGDRIFVIKPGTGKLARMIKLGKDETALAGLLGWGQQGLVAAFSAPGTPEKTAKPQDESGEDSKDGDAPSRDECKLAL